MLPKSDFKPAEAAAFWDLEGMSTSEFENLSERWLLDGLGGQELSVAAFGLPSVRLDAAPIIEKTLEELGVSNFSRQQLGWLAIHACHARLLDRRWATYEAAAIILQIEREFHQPPLFKGKDPHMAHVREQPPYNRNKDRMFAGEECRVNGILCAYHSKDDYHYDSNNEDEDYAAFVKRVERSVASDIMSEAEFSWNNYFSLTAELPEEYESLKAFL